MRQHQLKKMKEKHVVKLIDEKNENAYQVRLQFTKLKTLNIHYITNDLGCTSLKVRRDEKLLDQFLLLKAIIDGSLPKLLFKDIKIFQHICMDMFPEIETPQLANRHKVKEMIELQFEKNKMSFNDEIVQTTINLQQTMQCRHGIMCIG